ncbi:MAG: TerB family tellurite resistance protein, partial [Alphaproteobacteria bacterium]
MGIWGKILGGAAGFAIGGPLGALAGAVAGHAFDRMRSEDGDGDADAPDLAKQTTFAIAVIVLSAKMAKADGTVTRDEIDAFKEVFHIPPEEADNVSRLFNQARKDSQGFEPYARQVERMFRNNPVVMEELLGGLFHIARADGVAHPDEVRFLKDVSQIFGFEDATFERIRAAHLGAEKSDPYAILGVGHDSTDAEIRATWRKLIREHHPDTLIAQGMPQDFVDVATEEMA